MTARPQRRAAQRGFSMIEILITLLITAFGLLGLAAFASKATALSVDATQRARASALLNDMAGRVANNKVNAAAYLTGALGATGAADCTGLNGAPLDLCQWNNLLAGDNDARTGGNAAFLGYRGCITQPEVNVYVITVAWGSLTPGVPPADACAANAFGDDSQRRVIRAQVRVATLAA